jgi:hypothetical protein
MYRKYKKYYFVFCGVVIFLFLSSCKPKEESGMFVYELKKLAVSMDNFKSTIQNLDGKLNGNFQKDSDGNIIFYVDEKNDTYFEQNLSNGNLSFTRNMQNYLGNYKPELPAENQLKDISFEFLKKNELMPESMDEFHLIHSGGLRADLANGDGVIDKMRTLTFGRTIDGIPVIGSGSKIVVNIGDKGEITGLIHKWRELNQDNKRPVKSEEMITLEEAERNFRSIITTEFGKDAKAEIKNIKLVYYDGDGRFIQPVYGVESTVTVKLSENETNTIPYLAVVTAMKNPPEEINLREVSKDALRLVQKSLDEKGIPGIKENRD